jgi:hypothetical protein
MLDRPRDRRAASAPTRLYRRRARRGKALAMNEYDARLVDLLVRTHWLTESEAFDRHNIGQAIEALLRDAAG